MNDLFLLTLFLLGSGLYSGLETGVVSVNKLRLQHLVRSGSPAARTLQFFMDHPDYMLGTTLIGTNLCNTAFSTYTTRLFERTLPQGGSLVALVFSTIVILVFGEFLPKAWFQSDPENRTLRFTGWLHFFSKLFYPLTYTLSFLARTLIPAPKGAEFDDAFALTRDELRKLVPETQTPKVSYQQQRKKMLTSIFTLSERPCAELMLPISRVVVFNKNDTLKSCMERVRQHNYSRFPVYDAEVKQYIGVVHIMDLLRELRSNPDKPIRELKRPPRFVSKNMPSDRLIPQMQLSRQPFLLVRDNQENVIGFITMESILETIVGPLQ